jgi:nucleoside phosphorylase
MEEDITSATGKRCLKHEDYTVGWVCALSEELAAASAMLDELHEDLPRRQPDNNAYVLGNIGVHNVVIACLPQGESGTNSAATVATQMLSTFRSIKFGVIVGIGGGVPSDINDIRLGDVVVSTPTNAFGGVVQYDRGKIREDGLFERTGSLNSPPSAVRTALSKMKAIHVMNGSKIPEYLSEVERKHPNMSLLYTRHDGLDDILFKAEYNHVNNNDNCSSCDAAQRVIRPHRDRPTIHYGLIASGNQVMRDAVARDKNSKGFGGVLCFEMEAAGLMNTFPCIVIRGISDYADSHKNKQWQKYAATVAAASAKELLGYISKQEVADTPAVPGKSAQQAFPFLLFIIILTSTFEL